MKKRIGILEDNFTLRSNIGNYLLATGKYEIIFSAPNVKEACDAAHDSEVAPDVILLDIHLQGENSLEVIACMKEKYLGVTVVIMTGDNNEQFIMQAFENGASGYLYKPFKLGELVSTLEKLEADGSYLQPQVATKLISMLKKRDVVAELQKQFDLTERETEIIRGLKDGLSYQQIADKLFISYHTVNHHLKNVYLKTDVTSRTELVAQYFNSEKRGV